MRWPLSRAVVAGVSMAPVLMPGDHVVVRRCRRLRVGWIVVAAHPGHAGLILVKRLAGKPGDVVYGAPLGADEYWLASDNTLAAPDDSRAFGPVPRSAITGRVVVRYRPWTRSRRNGAASASEPNT